MISLALQSSVNSLKTVILIQYKNNVITLFVKYLKKKSLCSVKIVGVEVSHLSNPVGLYILRFNGDFYCTFHLFQGLWRANETVNSTQQQKQKQKQNKKNAEINSEIKNRGEQREWAFSFPLR